MVAVFCSLVLTGCQKPMAPLVAPEPPVQYEVNKYGVAPAQAPAASKRVLVVYNTTSQISRKIAQYYATKRRIPKDQVIGVTCLDGEQLGAIAYRQDIEEKVRAALRKKQDKIDFIVLTKGIPLRVGTSEGYSVDAKLMAMNRETEPIPETLANMPQDRIEAVVGRNTNPYAGATERFSAKKYNMTLVTRLDGYTYADIQGLIDRSIAAKPAKGPFLFDCADNRKGGGYGELQNTMISAHRMLSGAGVDAIIDEKKAFVNPGKALMGYCSWGSNDGAYDLATYKSLKFKPGAIAETFVSTSGRTMIPTDVGQSLIADLIKAGVTGVKGYVSEPYTFALCRADVLFTRYLNGFNLAESFYAASPVVHWKDIVIGDPLCNPYGKN